MQQLTMSQHLTDERITPAVPRCHLLRPRQVPIRWAGASIIDTGHLRRRNAALDANPAAVRAIH